MTATPTEETRCDMDRLQVRFVSAKLAKMFTGLIDAGLDARLVADAAFCAASSLKLEIDGSSGLSRTLKALAAEIAERAEAEGATAH
ncbi:MAG: hypothetical protein IOC82_15105 [Aestuariivirga sp.]|uniref:hypothetical protein n=1 Tax=Aestuariivirga sp. TaxID=2650926 RepID=UPI0025BE1AF7|nr:hypothetical protein [Aestuariivirga sp.]MCA3562351.1 hypothetical protein [Aestuariivirga sp.]